MKRFGPEAAEGPPAVLRIITVFLMVSMFWALFDQHASSWIAQAREMDRSFELFGKRFERPARADLGSQSAARDAARCR